MKQNMITLAQLKALLIVNERETVLAMRDKSPNGTKRISEVMLHRTMIKDLIIQELEYQVDSLFGSEHHAYS